MQNIKTFFNMLRQLFAILNGPQRKKTIALAVNQFIVAMFETLGISAIMPFIYAMVDPDKFMANKYVKIFTDMFGISTYREALFACAIMIVMVYVIKNLYILLSNFIQAGFRNGLERDLSITMLESYLSKPYSYHLVTNSAEILRGITTDTAGVASVVDGYSALIAEVITCILISIFLLVVSPFMAMGVLLISALTALGIIIGFKKKTAICGERCRNAFGRRFQYVNQSINGIKEITVMNRQRSFLSKFSETADEACRYNTSYLCIMKTPSRLIEMVFTSSLILIAYAGVRNADNAAAVVTQLGTMAVAASRMLPSISNVVSDMNTLIYNRPSLENAYQNIVKISSEEHTMIERIETKNEQPIENERCHLKDRIQVKDISWRYEEGRKNVLEDLSVDIRKGESVAFIGESGAGKTTLADIILGLFTPQKGEILVDGCDLQDMKDKWPQMIGYVPQNVFLIDDTLKNNIAFGLSDDEIDNEKIKAAVEQSQLMGTVAGLSKGLETELGENGIRLSGGQRQRIAIARALYYDPDILVLDEATSALDNETESAVMESIEKLQGQKTMIIVAHRLSTIRNCDTIYEIKGGRAVRRDKAELFPN